MKFVIQFILGRSDEDFREYLRDGICYVEDNKFRNLCSDYMSIRRIHQIKLSSTKPMYIASTIVSDGQEKDLERLQDAIGQVICSDPNFLLEEKYYYDQIEVGNSWAVCHTMCLQFHRFVKHVIGGTSQHIPMQRIVFGELPNNTGSWVLTNKDRKDEWHRMWLTAESGVYRYSNMLLCKA